MCDDSQPAAVAASSEPMMPSIWQVMVTCLRIGHPSHCYERGRTIFVRKRQFASGAPENHDAQVMRALGVELDETWRNAQRDVAVCAWCAAASASGTDGSMFGGARLRLLQLFCMKLIDFEITVIRW